jgi:malate dehydrogenase
MKVVVHGGAGGVGSSAAFNVLAEGLQAEVVLVGTDEAMLTSHAMDLEQVPELVCAGTVRTGALEDLGDADVAILAASVPQRPDMPRTEFAAENGEILRRVAALLPVTASAIVVSNPVDALVTRLWGDTTLDRRRLLGYTFNDSLRLRTGVARAIGAASGAVDAWVLGEHGETAVPIWSRLRVAGAPVDLEPSARAAAADFVRGWYRRHVALDSGRSSTWTTGLGVARMVAALAGEGPQLMPASVVLDGEYGIQDVAVGVPVTLGPGGAQEIHEWPLPADELDALRASAQAVRAVCGDLALHAAAQRS